MTVFQNKLVGEKNEAVPPQLKVTGKLEWVKPIQVDDYKFVQSQLKDPKSVVKVAVPSKPLSAAAVSEAADAFGAGPTMIHFRGGRAAVDIDSYPDMNAFFDDLAAAYRRELKALVDAGCKYIQLDDTNLAYLNDPDMRKAAEARGEDLETLPKQYAELINAALRDLPDDVTKAIHLCRGNFRSRHFASGSYEQVAKVLFNEINVHNFLLEFDDERSGSFEPLRFLPKGKTVTLGLVTTKRAELEDKASIMARIKEATKYAPLEQLSLSPQCGFASTSEGNDLSEEDQWNKIKLCREIVEEVWGKQ